MFYYLPLEQYPERYTMMMSCVNGWTESNLRQNNIEFVRIDGEQINNSIKSGVVLDACGRSYYANCQINQVIKLINEGKIKDNDIIYTEDFWHPSIESLFYIRHILNLKFKIACFLHAQSVDNTDFSYVMREWIRPIEQGFGKGYDCIFVCSKILKELCVKNGIGTDSSIHVIGLPYNSKRLIEQLKELGFKEREKKDYVLFSSRFDKEKDPHFFLDLVEACPDIQFKIVNPRKSVPISNDKTVVQRLTELLKKISNLEVVDTFDKIRYYETLQQAKVQINCAHQDWVSWTLLEAVTFKCLPLYPVWKDFPLELSYDSRFLYSKGNLTECIEKLRKLLKLNYDNVLNKIVKKHDNSWNEYIRILKK